jgi:hypothetical protein
VTTKRRTRSTYRSLNKVAVLFGCERRMFIFAMFAGGAGFQATRSAKLGLAIFFCFYLTGIMQVRDALWLKLTFNRGKYREFYDAGKREPFFVEFTE